jgi:hypothetical protein
MFFLFSLIPLSKPMSEENKNTTGRFSHTPKPHRSIFSESTAEENKSITTQTRGKSGFDHFKSSIFDSNVQEPAIKRNNYNSSKIFEVADASSNKHGIPRRKNNNSSSIVFGNPEEAGTKPGNLNNRSKKHLEPPTGNGNHSISNYAGSETSSANSHEKIDPSTMRAAGMPTRTNRR